MKQQTITITSTFTAELLEESIAFWMRQIGLPGKIEFAPYNQVFQQLLDPSSLLSSPDEGLNVILIRFHDWQRHHPNMGREKLIQNVNELISSIKSSAEHHHVPYIVGICPSPDEPEQRSLYGHMEHLLKSKLEPLSRIHIIAPTNLAKIYPVPNIHDPLADSIGHIPFTPTFFAALGTMIFRKWMALVNQPFKVIVLDCDQTLWGGIVAEDGIKGIMIDSEYQKLQQFMINQHEAGLLLCLCSKNNEQDVVSVFKQHPQMILKLHHIVSHRINWHPKSLNIKALAAELNLGLDSFIFLDDNPIECAEVHAKHPEILTLQLPSAVEEIPNFLNHIWAFDHLNTTAEDLRRTNLYQQNMSREAYRDEVLNLADFISGLELKVQISELTEKQLARVAQLTQRTNQFNLSTKMRSEGEIRHLSITTKKLDCLTVSVGDRFGDYGLVGVMMFRTEDHCLMVDTFLLSCRVLGRGVEHEMLAQLGVIAQDRGFDRINMTCIETKRNQPVISFLNGFSEEHQCSQPEGIHYCLASKNLLGLHFEPDTTKTTGFKSAAKNNQDIPRVVTASFLKHIASEYDTPEKILRAIHLDKEKDRPGQSISYIAPRSPTEKALAEIWSHILGIKEVGIKDNFFELGGHSLAATQVVTRIWHDLGVELPINSILETPYIEGMAQTISNRKNKKNEVDEKTLAILLNEITQLSEEEARKILERKMKPKGNHSVSARKSHRLTNDHDVMEQNPTDQPKISTIGIVTHNRVQALKRALTSYINNTQQFGRACDFLVLDDSDDLRTRKSNNQMLCEIQKKYDVPISYAGPEERARFARQLIKRGNIPSEAVNFALFDSENCGQTYGVNRNAMLLHTLGDMVFCPDDDTICRVTTSPESKGSVKFISDRDPADFWFSTDQGNVDHPGILDELDILSGHEQLLGQPINAFLSNSNELDLSQVNPHFQRRLLTNQGNVRVTFNGMAGDCAWGSPFGNWGTPMGYLLMHGKSHHRLVQSESSYRTTCLSRNLFRMVNQPTISDASFSLTVFLGLDNRHILPPFMPVKRGEDLIFGTLLSRCFEHAFLGHLPFTLLHAPEKKRLFWPGEIIRSASGYDTAKLVLDCIQSVKFLSNEDSAEKKLKIMGKHLENLGSMPLKDFEAAVTLQIKQTTNSFINLMEKHLNTHGNSPEYWAHDIKNYITVLRDSIPKKDYWVPLDLLNKRNTSEARVLAQKLIQRFGQLLHWWPEIVHTASQLRAQGVRLAQPLQRKLE